MLTKVLSLKLSLGIVGALALISLFAFPNYPGSYGLLCAFDASWLTLLLSAIYMPLFYVYFFTAIMLFLGFWSKFFLHFIFKIAFLEPLGSWPVIDSAAAWNQVLISSSLVPLALLSINIIFLLLLRAKKDQKSAFLVQNHQVPNWYITYRKMAWFCAVGISLIANCINFSTHIYTTGIITSFVLPFHLNGIIIWFLLFSPALFMAAFLGWDHTLQIKDRSKAYYLLILIAVVTSITTLSRFIYLFWTAPYFLILLKHNRTLKAGYKIITENKLLIAAYVFGGILSMFFVNGLRHYYYFANRNLLPPPPVNLTYLLIGILSLLMIIKIREIIYSKKFKQNIGFIACYVIMILILVFSSSLVYNNSKIAAISSEHPSGQEENPMASHSKTSFVLDQVTKLLYSRFVGLEGIMATTAYPYTGEKLLIAGLTEKPKIDGAGIYNNKILNITSQYAANRISASLPGLSGILNYSDSRLILYAGMFLGMLLLCLTELLSFKLLKNEFFLAQQGLLLGYFCISNLNIPYLGLINFIEYVAVTIFLMALTYFYNYKQIKFRSKTTTV